MAKYKPYDYSQTVLLPVSLSDQLMPGTLEFAINTLLEERLDLSQFDKRYNKMRPVAVPMIPRYC